MQFLMLNIGRTILLALNFLCGAYMFLGNIYNTEI